MVSSTPWQDALRHVITDPKELLHLLELDPALEQAARAASQLFPLRVPRGFVARMKKGDISDPLLRQVLPLGDELTIMPGYEQDPLQEKKVNPVPGLLHKYKGRVLITLTPICAIHCRYCFRREFPYAENHPGKQGWEKLWDYIASDPTIEEVILSGGDPLSVNEKILFTFSEELAALSQIKTLRIHTRLPIVLPERITADFIQWLGCLKQKVVMVVHCNHAQEINEEVKQGLRALHAAGVILLNHTVLLKGVNDNADTLIELNKALFAMNVLPYYLNLLDKVHGTHHFDVALSQAKAIHQTLVASLPGYLVPRLAREVPGAKAKVEGMYIIDAE